VIQGFFGNTGPRILEKQNQSVFGAPLTDLQGAGGFRVPQVVFQQVGKELLQPIGIADNGNGGLIFQVVFNRNLVLSKTL
jgi:hypothetical protein